MIPKQAQQILDEIAKTDFKPRGKDAALIRSVKDKIKADSLISYGQAKWLQDIYIRAVGGGTYQTRQII